MPRTERLAIVVIPLVVVVVFALGLRIGAERPMRAVVVYGAPPARGRSGLSWQIVTLLDSGGAREAKPMSGLSVTARAGDESASWTGSTNSDGVAEVWLDLPDAKRGERLHLTVSAVGEAAPLADGDVRWEERPWGPTTDVPGFVRPSKRDGALLIDVAVEGERLAPMFPSSLFVRVLDGASGRPAPLVKLAADPEPGLALSEESVRTCDNGWTELRATAEAHVVGLGLQAANAAGGRGAWYGSLPVAPGASHASLPAHIQPGAPFVADLRAAGAGSIVYMEVDDRSGRAFAAAPPLSPQTGALPAASVEVPGLGEGRYWLVTAGEPRGAESLAGSAVAQPFWVSASPRPAGCARGFDVATAEAAPFVRWVALDGVAGKRGGRTSRRIRGLFVAILALVAGAAIEVLLLLRASARARAELARLDAELGGGSAVASAKRPPGGVVAVALLLALLGFALLAALLSLRTG